MELSLERYKLKLFKHFAQDASSDTSVYHWFEHLLTLKLTFSNPRQIGQKAALWMNYNSQVFMYLR